MLWSIVITIACVIIYSNIKLSEPKPFEVKGKKFIYNSTEDGLGNYNFSYVDKVELVRRMETGKIVKSNSGKEILVVKGSYGTAFAVGDCQTINVKYNADENGFRATFHYEEKHRESKEGENRLVSLCDFRYKEIDAPQNIRTDCIKSLTCGG